MGPQLWSVGIPDAQEIKTILLARPDLADRVEAKMQDAYADAVALIRMHRSALDALVGALLASEVLDGTEVTAIIAAASKAPPTVVVGEPRVPPCTPAVPTGGMQ
jgi:hypothetical protein